MGCCAVGDGVPCDGKAFGGGAFLAEKKGCLLGCVLAPMCAKAHMDTAVTARKDRRISGKMRKLALSDEVLLSIDKPARYIGGEVNSVVKDPSKVDIRFAMCFPDVNERYEDATRY